MVINKCKRILHRAKLHNLHSNSHNNRTPLVISKHKRILHRAKLHSLLNSHS